MKPFNRTKICTILNSRQHHFPSLDCEWVQSSVDAMKWISQQGFIVCTSFGVQTWELILHLACKYNVPQLIFLCETDFTSQIKYVRKNFTLDETRCRFIPVCSQQPIHRDSYIIFLSDILIPVSIRNNGTLKTLIENAADKTITQLFSRPYQTRARQNKFSINHSMLNTKELELLSNSYLFHWTRSFKGPWPTETASDYYSAVISNTTYPRTALHSLQNILTTNKISASSFNITNACPVTCFSALPPLSFTHLIRWRSRYHQMSFEPYAIGISKKLGEASGIEPVIYHEIKKVPDNYYPAWKLQSRGTITAWSSEDEYRCLGDFDFSRIDPHDMICLCLTPHEKSMLQKFTKIRVVSIYKDDTAN